MAILWCFAHWPEVKNLFQLFANFHHQSVHKAPGATLRETHKKCISETDYKQFFAFHVFSKNGPQKMLKKGLPQMKFFKNLFDTEAA